MSILVGDKEREALKGVGNLLRQVLPTGIGFAVFLSTGHYLSNCNRDDALSAISEWAKRADVRAEAAIRGHGKRVRPVISDLEERCAHLGRNLTKALPITLFLFHEKELAYFSSIPDAPAKIGQWIATQGQVPS